MDSHKTEKLMLRTFSLLLFLTLVLPATAQKNWRDTLFNGKSGICDTTGKIIIPAIYDEITPYSFNAFDWTSGSMIGSGETVFVVKKGKRFGLFDGQGKALLQVLYEDVVVDYGEGGKYRIIAAKQKKRYGFFDPDGNAITGFVFTEIDTGDFGDGIIAYVKKKGEREFVLLDKTGRLRR